MPKTVVFDVGKVLVNFSFLGFQDFLIKHGANFKDTNDFILKTSLYDFEKGLISAAEFYQKVNNNLKLTVADHEIELQWKSIFSPFEEMIKLLQDVRKHRPTFLLSNTNKVHWNYLMTNYKLENYVEGYLTSFDAKAMKPDPKIYHEFTNRFGFKEKDILFIDDLSENIQAAQKHGWHTIHHVSEQETRSKILDFLPI